MSPDLSDLLKLLFKLFDIALRFMNVCSYFSAVSIMLVELLEWLIPEGYQFLLVSLLSPHLYLISDLCELSELPLSYLSKSLTSGCICSVNFYTLLIVGAM